MILFGSRSLASSKPERRVGGKCIVTSYKKDRGSAEDRNILRKAQRRLRPSLRSARRPSAAHRPRSGTMPGAGSSCSRGRLPGGQCAGTDLQPERGLRGGQWSYPDRCHPDAAAAGSRVLLAECFRRSRKTCLLLSYAGVESPAESSPKTSRPPLQTQTLKAAYAGVSTV